MEVTVRVPFTMPHYVARPLELTMVPGASHDVFAQHMRDELARITADFVQALDVLAKAERNDHA